MERIASLRGWSHDFAWSDAWLLAGLLCSCLVLLVFLVRNHGGRRRSIGLLFSAGLLVHGLLISGLAAQLSADLECHMPVGSVCHGFMDVPVWLQLSLASLNHGGAAVFAVIGGGLFAHWVVVRDSPGEQTG